MTNDTITLTREEAQKLLDGFNRVGWARTEHADILRARLAQPEPEPVAWLITDEMINSLQIDSIQRLIDRARHAHMTDIKLRINGQDEWYEADWLKHLKRAAPPQRERIVYCGCGDGIVPDDGAECGTCVSMRQREWQGLTDEEIRNEAKNHVFDESFFSGAVWARGKIMGKNHG